MHSDQKRSVRITIERVSITTIRSRSTKTYCEICRRSLAAEDMQAAQTVIELDELIEGAEAAGETEYKEGE